jgi:hypothetical protein
MINELIIASVMICMTPRYIRSRLILSCCDSVWTPVQTLPAEISEYFVDELGNPSINYGGFLQIINPSVLDLLPEKELFACFRCITKEYIEHVQVNPPKAIYSRLIDSLIFVGWDISTGNGWLSASCHGSFPINPYTGEELDQNVNKLNEFALFSDSNDCLLCCQTNNSLIPEHAPWFPVAVFVDPGSYARLKAIIEKTGRDTS